MNCILRKLLLDRLNKLIETYKTDIDGSRKTVETWLARTTAVAQYVKSLSDALEDGKIDETEVENAVQRIKDLV